jgi:uncharacterized protein YeaC (DUF1315 family)
MVTAAEGHRLWRAELKSPTPEERRTDRTTDALLMQGRWRIVGPRTGIDTPVAIWADDGQDWAIFQKGRKRPIVTGDVSIPVNPDGPSESAAEVWQRFLDKDWFKCIAVEVAAYDMALTTGKWPDGKAAREFTEAEKLGLVPAAADTEGRGTNMPPEEAEAAMDAQIIEKIEAELAKIPDVKFPLNKDSATFAASIVEKLRGLGKQGEPRRKSQKQPFIDGGNAVDAKWFSLKTASDAIANLVTGINAYTKAEEARLLAEQRKAAEAERLRLIAVAEENARKEAEQAARDALARGEAYEEPTAEAIAEQVAAEVEQKIAEAPPVEAPKVVVRGSEQSRAITKATTRTARIFDMALMAAHFTDTKDADFIDYMQKRGNAAARAKVTLPGMEIE